MVLFSCFFIIKAWNLKLIWNRIPTLKKLLFIFTKCRIISESFPSERQFPVSTVELYIGDGTKLCTGAGTMLYTAGTKDLHDGYSSGTLRLYRNCISSLFTWGWFLKNGKKKGRKGRFFKNKKKNKIAASKLGKLIHMIYLHF